MVELKIKCYNLYACKAYRKEVVNMKKKIIYFAAAVICSIPIFKAIKEPTVILPDTVIIEESEQREKEEHAEGSISPMIDDDEEISLH